jgi:hypothetical protein
MVLIWIHCAGHVAESTMVFLFFLLQSRCPTPPHNHTSMSSQRVCLPHGSKTLRAMLVGMLLAQFIRSRVV